MQVRQEVVVPMRPDGRQQLGRWLVEAEREIRQALDQAEASLAGYRRALAALGELRREVDAPLASPERMRATLRAVGGPTPSLSPFELDGWREPAILTIARDPEVSSPLSPREQEVLALLSGGRSNKEIAVHLAISVRTVERHINNIYRKLGVQNRTEATVYAMRCQLT